MNTRTTQPATDEPVAFDPQTGEMLEPATKLVQRPLFAPPPFDVEAAFDQIARRADTVRAARNEYEALKDEAAHAKKEWEKRSKELDDLIRDLRVHREQSRLGVENAPAPDETDAEHQAPDDAPAPDETPAVPADIPLPVRRRSRIPVDTSTEDELDERLVDLMPDEEGE